MSELNCGSYNYKGKWGWLTNNYFIKFDRET